MADSRIAAPRGYRWATGGGSVFGDCNMRHLAYENKVGTLCGRMGPADMPDAEPGARICGTCARVARIGRLAGNPPCYSDHVWGEWQNDVAGVVRLCTRGCGAVDWRPEG